MIDYELQGMMAHTVTLEQFVVKDGYSRPSFTSPVTLKARIEQRNQFVRDNAGREVVSSTTVYLEPVAVRIEDRLTLPDGSTPAILSVQSVDDEVGPVMTVVYT